MTVRNGKNIPPAIEKRARLGRFRGIVGSAPEIRQSQFNIDGKIRLFDGRSISDCHALNSNKHDDVAQLYAFDLLSIGKEDLRDTPLHDLKGLLHVPAPGAERCLGMAMHKRINRSPAIEIAPTAVRWIVVPEQEPSGFGNRLSLSEPFLDSQDRL